MCKPPCQEKRESWMTMSVFVPVCALSCVHIMCIMHEAVYKVIWQFTCVCVCACVRQNMSDCVWLPVLHLNHSWQSERNTSVQSYECKEWAVERGSREWALDMNDWWLQKYHWVTIYFCIFLQMKSAPQPTARSQVSVLCSCRFFIVSI